MSQIRDPSRNLRILRPRSPRSRWSLRRRRSSTLADMTTTDGTDGGVRISVADIFRELRSLKGDVRSIKQSMDELVKPTLAAHDRQFEVQEKQLDSLNVKFYGVLAGGVLGVLGIIADALGVFA